MDECYSCGSLRKTKLQMGWVIAFLASTTILYIVLAAREESHAARAEMDLYQAQKSIAGLKANAGRPIRANDGAYGVYACFTDGCVLNSLERADIEREGASVVRFYSLGRVPYNRPAAGQVVRIVGGDVVEVYDKISK